MTKILKHNEISENQKKIFIEGPFCYETNMLIFSFFKLLQIRIKRNVNEINISLETFVLHGRNLYEFYFFDNRYEDDARAFDFIDINKLNNIRKSLNLSKNDFGYKFKTNKQLAHLTYTRLNYEQSYEKEWKVNEIMKDFVHITKFFIIELNKKHKGEKILELKTLLDNNYFLNKYFEDIEYFIEAKKQLNESKTDKDKDYYERRCSDLDRQIDSEVYKLYNLTEEEIKIVEGKE